MRQSPKAPERLVDQGGRRPLREREGAVPPEDFTKALESGRTRARTQRAQPGAELLSARTAPGERQEHGQCVDPFAEVGAGLAPELRSADEIAHVVRELKARPT